jgi:hypothetical protein
MKKGQSNIIGFMMVMLIVLVVVSGTFFWAKDLLEESKQVNDLSRVENRMIALDNAIREVANEQSQRSLNFKIDGGYLFIEDNHTITYTSNKVVPSEFDSSGVAIFGNTSAGSSCFDYSVRGELGEDRSSCIIKKGRDISVNYIMLNDTTNNDCYSVQFIAGSSGAAGNGEHNMLISYAYTNTTTECNTSYIQVIKIDID